MILITTSWRLNGYQYMVTKGMLPDHFFMGGVFKTQTDFGPVLLRQGGPGTSQYIANNSVKQEGPLDVPLNSLIQFMAKCSSLAFQCSGKSLSKCKGKSYLVRQKDLSTFCYFYHIMVVTNKLC